MAVYHSQLVELLQRIQCKASWNVYAFHVCLYICPYLNHGAHLNVGMFPCNTTHDWGSTFKGSDLCLSTDDVATPQGQRPLGYWIAFFITTKCNITERRQIRKTIMSSTEAIQHLTWDQIPSDNTEPDHRNNGFSFTSTGQWENKIQRCL